MLSGTLFACLTAYVAAFVFEVAGLRRRFHWQRRLLIVGALSALATHTLYLVQSAKNTSGLPSSTADWLLWAGWLLAVVYAAALFYLRRSPTGVVLIPIVAGLILSSRWASTDPLASGSSFYIWGRIHGLLLLAGTVAVCVGFLAGLMYLLQSYALKHARSFASPLRLPSLEWLERVNSRVLGLSAVLIALGFVSGVVMSTVHHRGEPAYALWTDPVVLSLASMLLWLIAAEVFRFVYPAARRGRKVAYLTLASFVFLVIALASFTLLDNVHAPNRRERARQQGRVAVNPQSAIEYQTALL
jgi:ABC-type uncharacterized transport system permease subunit